MVRNELQKSEGRGEEPRDFGDKMPEVSETTEMEERKCRGIRDQKLVPENKSGCRSEHNQGGQFHKRHKVMCTASREGQNSLRLREEWKGGKEVVNDPDRSRSRGRAEDRRRPEISRMDGEVVRADGSTEGQRPEVVRTEVGGRIGGEPEHSEVPGAANSADSAGSIGIGGGNAGDDDGSALHLSLKTNQSKLKRWFHIQADAVVLPGVARIFWGGSAQTSILVTTHWSPSTDHMFARSTTTVSQWWDLPQKGDIVEDIVVAAIQLLAKNTDPWMDSTHNAWFCRLDAYKMLKSMSSRQIADNMAGMHGNGGG
ncbi:hypothetical protein DFH06DRAFT_1121811 [Mycena polygramma]|nr:hypothetical protein DFH06DRAFT_1121811 [Mycena polygramma]